MADQKGRYSIMLAAKDGFSKPFRDFAAAGARLEDSVRDQSKTLRELNRVAGDLDGFEKARYQLNNTGQALAEARAEQARLTKEVRASDNPTKRQVDALERARVKTGQLVNQQRTERNELGRLSSRLKEAGYDGDKFAESQRKLEARTEQVTASLEKQRAQLGRLNAAQSKVEANKAARGELHGQLLGVAAAGYMATRPLQKAVSYESAMADVSKVVNFDDEAEKAKMSRDLLRMSQQREIAGGGITAEGLAQIVASAGQSGIAKAELLPFAQSAARMATAFDISAEEAGSTMAAWRASMGLSQAEAENLADAANHLSNNMNAKAADVADVLKRQGAVAMAAGLSETQTAALAASLLSGGAGSEIAATALKNGVGALTKGSRATKAQQEAFDELGFDSGDLAKSMQVDAPETIIKVFEALQRKPPDEIPALVSTIFGEESKGAIQPLLSNLDELRKSFKTTADQATYTGSMNAEAAARAKTSEALFNRLGATWDRIQITLGTLLLPTLVEIAEPAADFASAIGDAADEYPRIAGALVKVGAALVAIKAGAIALRFAGLSAKQVFNKGDVARNKLNITTGRYANDARAATARLSAAVNRLGRGGAGAGAGAGGRGRRGRAARPARARGGLLGRASAAFGAGAPAAATVAGRGARLLGGLGRVGGAAARRLPAVGLLMGAPQLASAAMAGDSSGVGESAGSMAGGLAGGWGGAAMGAAIGTAILPGLGTAIGGALGGIAGGVAASEAGGWLGRKVGGWFGGNDKPPAPAVTKDVPTVQVPKALIDQLAKDQKAKTDRVPSPEEAAKAITNNTDARQITLSPQIHIEAGRDPALDQKLVADIMAQLKAQLVPMMQQSSSLSVRMDASLTDGGGS